MTGYKERVNEFYDRFAQQERPLRAAMSRGELEEATQQMHELLRPVLGDLLFRLYKKDESCILEFDTMLDSSKKILCFYFCDQLPEALKKYWTFYYYHPAFRGSLTVGSVVFQPQDFLVIPSVQDKTHKIDLQIVQTDKFKGISDQDRYAITYMMLIDYLGEITAEAYVGQISFVKKSSVFRQREAASMSIDKLRTYLKRTIQSKGWVAPGEIKLIADSFKTKNKNKECRKDIHFGVSYSLDLLNEEEHPAEERTKTQYVLDCGVRYAALVLPRGQRSDEECKKEKEKWEKQLSDIFSKGHSGAIVTSSEGNTNDYIDFFAYSEETYLAILQEAERSSPKLSVVELGKPSDSEPELPSPLA